MKLKTQHPEIYLRSYTLQDVDALTVLANNKNIWQFLRDSFPYPYHKNNAEKFIKMCLESEPQTILGIEYQGVLVGSIGLHLQNDVYRYSAEMGYFIGEPYWNKSIATFAVQTMLQFGFENLHLQRIFASVFEPNEGSKRVLLKNGFLLEGVKKKSIYKNNQFLDEFLYGIVKED